MMLMLLELGLENIVFVYIEREKGVIGKIRV